MILQGFECSRTRRIVEKLFSPFPTSPSLSFHVISSCLIRATNTVRSTRNRYITRNGMTKAGRSIRGYAWVKWSTVESSLAIRVPKMIGSVPFDQVAIDYDYSIVIGFFWLNQSDQLTDHVELVLLKMVGI